MTSLTRVVVIGGGISGLAACHELLARGVRPILLSEGLGATELSSGGWDLNPWTEPHGPRKVKGESASWVRGFLGRLGLLGAVASSEEGQVPSSEEMDPEWVATMQGVLRPVSVLGPSLLGFKTLASQAGRGARVGVLSTGRVDFNSPSLCRSFNEESFALEHQLQFSPVEIPGILTASETVYPLAQLYRVFDEPARKEKLQEALSQFLASDAAPEGLLVPPLLGSSLSFPVPKGKMVGETLSPPEGPFGARYRRAREAYLSESGLEQFSERVTKLTPEAEGVRVESLDPATERVTRWASGVILATGGLIGGGVTLNPQTERLPSQLAVELAEPRLLVGGSREGFDPARDEGRWIQAPHVEGRSRARLVVSAGDARREDEQPEWWGGTFLGAALSGRDASRKLLKEIEA